MFTFAKAAEFTLTREHPVPGWARTAKALVTRGKWACGSSDASGSPTEHWSHRAQYPRHPSPITPGYPTSGLQPAAQERKGEAPLELHFQNQEQGRLSKMCFPENALLKDKLSKKKKNSMAK